MAWPGAPKSASSPPLNVPSTRFPFSLNENSTMHEVSEAMRTAFNGLTVHEQAFAALPSNIASQAKAAATAAVTEIVSQQTVTGVTSFNTNTGAIIYFPNLGQVNDQRGNPSYVTQTSDAGEKIVVGDSTPVIVTLDTTVNLPWFAFIGNDSSTTAYITTDSSATILGLNSIYPGGMALIFFDGTTFWSEGVAIATDSSLGVVKPDGLTINVDSTGTISTTGLFIGNYRSINAPTTIGRFDYQIEITSGTFTQPLPDAVGIAGRVYSIKNSGTGTVTVSAFGSETIDGSLTQPMIQYDNLVVMSNGANWIIL